MHTPQREITVYLNLSYRLDAHKVHPYEFCIQYQVRSVRAAHEARSAEFAKRKGLPSVRWVYLTAMPRSPAINESERDYHLLDGFT